MSTAVLDEIVEKAAVLSRAERRELIRRLQKQQIEMEIEELKSTAKLKNEQHLNPNIEWLKQNSSKYQGLHVTLKDGELISTGRTTKEADLAAKKKGFNKTLWAYIPRDDEELWGGW